MSRDGVFGMLIGAAVGTLLLVSAHGSAQDASPDVCADVNLRSPLEDVTRCAELGTAQAQYRLGLVYDFDAFSASRDPADAVRWYRLAAEQGYRPAQFSLGLVYRDGNGVPKDLVLAYVWFNLSAAEGSGVARSSREEIEPLMTREQIAEAQRLSREWIEAHPPDGGN